MKLEYLENISDRGKYIDVITDQLVRLYAFDNVQVQELCNAIQQTVIINNIFLNLKTLPFIEIINCDLTLRLSNRDIGITTIDKKEFYCDLTSKAYQDMINLLEPFIQGSKGYQWLYDLDNSIEFLFSSNGQW